MLTSGINHVAVLTADTDRFVEFYESVFGATSVVADEGDGFKLTIVYVGPTSELNVFQVDGNDEAARQVPMFGRGRLDHMALHADTLEDFAEIRRRLIERGAADEFVTDFGPILSLFFRDPDGLEAEVCTMNPDWKQGDGFNKPGTPARRFVPAD